MSDEKLNKVVVVIAGGIAHLDEDNRTALLSQIRDQQLNPDLEWEDIAVLENPDLLDLMLKEGEDPDPYQKYWDKLIVEEALGVPRVYH